MQLLDYIKKQKVRTIAVTVTIFLLPIIIVHILFKINVPCDWFVAEWSAGDLLSYFGSILSAVATIAAIALTIQFTLSNQKEERKLSIKPHLQTTYNPLFNRIDAANMANGKTVFLTYPYDKDEHISSSLEAPYLLTKKDSDSTQGAIINNLSFVKKYHIIHYSLTNVGAGNAVNLTLSIDSKQCLPAFALVAGNSKEFIIIFKSNLLHGQKRRIFFTFKYSDVASIANYEQHETIAFYADDNSSLNTSQDMDDLITMPQE